MSDRARFVGPLVRGPPGPYPVGREAFDAMTRGEQDRLFGVAVAERIRRGEVTVAQVLAAR